MLLDVSVIAFRFLLWVFSGGEIADVLVSKWLVIMTILLALFLGSWDSQKKKRRIDKRHHQADNAEIDRRVIPELPE